MSTDRITCSAVAGRLFEYGYTADSFPRDEPSMAFLIAKAFETPFEGRTIRLAELPATEADFREIRKRLDLIERAEARAA